MQYIVIILFWTAGCHVLLSCYEAYLRRKALIDERRKRQTAAK